MLSREMAYWCTGSAFFQIPQSYAVKRDAKCKEISKRIE